MYKRVIINESEKDQIKNMYGLNDQTVYNSFMLDLLKKSLGLDFDSSGNEKSQLDSKDFFSGKSGKIEIKGSFDGAQMENIKLIIDEMEKAGIKDPLAQIGILSVISKENGFRTFKEIGYCNTSNTRIRSIFGKRTTKYSDSELNKLKCNDPAFFDAMYGRNSGMSLGNTEPGDGWKYVGRGFNGLTGRANYSKYGSMVGLDLVGNPKLMEDPRVAAKVAIAFFTKGKSPSTFPKFESKVDAAKYFADLNSGGESKFGRTPAIAATEKFDVKFNDLA